MTEKAYINKEIIALFDYTNNIGAKEHLKGLFERAGLTHEDVMARQQLLRTFIAQWELLGNFGYERYDFEEVYNFTTTLKNQYGADGPDKMTLLFSKDKHRLKAGCVQAVLFFDRLYTLYFKQAGRVVFPGPFQSCIERIGAFLDSIETAQLVMKIKRGGHLVDDRLVWFAEVATTKGYQRSVIPFLAILVCVRGYLVCGQRYPGAPFCFPGVYAECFCAEAVWSSYAQKAGP